MSRHVEVLFPPAFHNGSRTCTSAKMWELENPLRGVDIKDEVWDTFLEKVFRAWASNTWGTLCDIMVCLTVVGIPVLCCKETVALDKAEAVVQKHALTDLNCAVRCSRTSVTEAVGAVRKLVVIFTPMLSAHESTTSFSPIIVDYDAQKDATAAQGIAGLWHARAQGCRGSSDPMSRGNEDGGENKRQSASKLVNTPKASLKTKKDVQQSRNSVKVVAKPGPLSKFARDDENNANSDSFRISRISAPAKRGDGEPRLSQATAVSETDPSDIEANGCSSSDSSRDHTPPTTSRRNSNGSSGRPSPSKMHTKMFAPRDSARISPASDLN